MVIAILAAISIVAYNSIQDRAAQTQTVAALSNYVKAISAYAVDNGTYPAFQNACLGGANNPNNRCFQVSDGVSSCTGYGPAYGKPAFDATLRPYLGNALPTPSPKSYNCGGAQYAGGLYYSPNTKSAVLYVFMKASLGACPLVGGATVVITNAQDEVIVCKYSLPALP